MDPLNITWFLLSYRYSILLSQSTTSHAPLITTLSFKFLGLIHLHPTSNLNFDGSVSNNTAVVGVNIHNNNGELIHATSYNLGITLVFVVEAIALQKGLLLALNHVIQKIHIKGDNLLVINAIKKLWKVPWQIQLIIHDIHALYQLYPSCL